MDNNGYDEDEDWLIYDDYDFGPLWRAVATVTIVILSILPGAYLLDYIAAYLWSFLHYAVPGAGQ